MARSQRPTRHRRVRETASARYSPSPSEGDVGILLDSDVIIDVLRGRPNVVTELRTIEADGTPVYCTAVSWAELFAGMRPGEEAVTEAFFHARGEVVIDAVTGRRAGAYLARYARSHGLQIADALIAAAASTAGLRLWTLNRRHYPMDDVRFHG